MAEKQIGFKLPKTTLEELSDIGGNIVGGLVLAAGFILILAAVKRG
jgi:hypothetical protein